MVALERLLTWRHALLGAAHQAWRTGLIHLVGMVVFVQGLTYGLQLVLARLVSPAEFGIVRNVEAVLVILISIGSAGMPTLVVKLMAAAEPRFRGPLLLRLTSLAMGASAISALVTVGTAPLYLARVAQPYLLILIGCCLLTAGGRTLINYFLATKQVRRMASVSVILSLTTIGIVLLAVATIGLPGWILGRYLGEGLFLVASIWLVRQGLSLNGALPAEYSHSALLSEGVLTAASLGIRSVLDNAGLLALGYANQPATELGHYGLSSLLITLGLIVPGAISNLALPRLVEKRASPQLAAFYFRRVLIGGLGLALMGSVALFGLSVVLPWLFGSDYAPASTLLSVLALGLPFRAISIIASSQLLAHNYVHISTVVNLILMLVIFGIFVVVVPTYGAFGAAWVTVGVEAVSALIYITMARHAEK
jgi:O-antigen/teichoic acid export membrane protein